MTPKTIWHHKNTPFVLVLALSTAVRLAFWHYANWTIEDGMIVGRVVRNFTQHGVLSYNVGQRVSSVTSPVFALLTGLLALSGVDPLAGAKVLGIAASVLTCLLLYGILRSLLSPYVALAASAVFVLLPPIIAYSIAGLETPFYALVCCLALERAWRQKYQQAFLVGAFSIIVRPDGAIALLIVCGVIAWQYKGNLKAIPALLWPGLLILLIGLGAHWLYYGTLFPQTVIAKATGYAIDPISNVAKYLNRMFLAQPSGIPVYILALGGVYYAIRRQRGLLIFVAWYVAYHLFFMLRAPLFDWYLQPPLLVLGLFTGLGLVEFVSIGLTAIRRGAWIPQTQIAVAAVLWLVLLVSLIPYGKARIADQKSEEAVRGATGRWIAANTKSDSLIFTESLGYIGYYNPNPFVDWPGLSSSDVVQVLESSQSRTRNSDYRLIISTFQPQYLALRQSEWNDLKDTLAANYSICASFPDGTNPDTSYLMACRNSQSG